MGTVTRSSWMFSEFSEATYSIHLPTSTTVFQGQSLEMLLLAKPRHKAEGKTPARWQWSDYASELDVEVEICTVRAAGVKDDTELRESSLRREYDGEQTEHDRGVLSRTNATVTLVGKDGRGAQLLALLPPTLVEGCYAYFIVKKIRVPEAFLAQPLILSAIVSPVADTRSTSSRGRTESTDAAGTILNLESRLLSFDLNGGAHTARPPVAQTEITLEVLRPLKVRSTAAGIGSWTTMVNVEVENTHPSALLWLRGLDLHLGATKRVGDQRLTVNTGAGGGALGHIANAGQEGAEAIRYPVLVGKSQAAAKKAQASTVPASSLDDMGALFHASWVGIDNGVAPLPWVPVPVAPGQKVAFVVCISPDATTSPLPPRKASGSLRTPLSVRWDLDKEFESEGLDSATPSDSHVYVHLVDWSLELRSAGAEAVLRIENATSKAVLNQPFGVTVLVRNLSTTPRDLSLLFGDAEAAPAPNATGQRKASHTGKLSSGLHNQPRRSSIGEASASHTYESVSGMLPLNAATPLGTLAPQAEASAVVWFLPLHAGLVCLPEVRLQESGEEDRHIKSSPHQVLVEAA